MDAELSSPSVNSFGFVVTDIAALRRITAEQLLRFGKRQIAYLTTGLHKGERAFTLVRADGEPIVVVESLQGAARAAMHLSLELVAVH